MDSVKAPVRSNSAPSEVWYAFLASTRFWVMIAGALSVYLETKGYIGEAERNLIATVSAIFVTVRTFDRGAEKMGNS